MPKATLLIVEDDGILAADLEDTITRLGYAVLGPVATGEEAIALFVNHEPDLVLMDIELAGTLNGIQTAEFLSRATGVPIVFLTGYSHDTLLEQAKVIAPYGFLVKPVRERELAATITMSLHRHDLDQQLKESRIALEKSETQYHLQMEATLKDSERRYREVVQNVNSAILRWKQDGIITFVNEFAQTFFGYREDEIIGRHVSMFVPQNDSNGADLSRMYRDIVAYPERHKNFENENICRDGRKVWMSWTNKPILDSYGQVVEILAVGNDITAHKLTEVYREMGREILQTLNEPGVLSDSFQHVVDILKERTGFDAVGLRLQAGEDFPYFAYNGFPREFIQRENTLIGPVANGELCRDEDGNLRLECTCGLVLSGKAALSHSLFTPGGSFWTNDSYPLLNIPSCEDPRFQPRNQCIFHDYASFALIPIRDKEKIVGLIQFNDHRNECFTLDSIEILEGIASHVGAALMRKKVEMALQESRRQYLHAEKLSVIGKLSASIAHEFNNPLQGILSILKGVKKRATMDEADKELLDAAITEGNRMKDLIRNLQEFNRPSSGRKTAMDMHQALDSLLLLQKSDLTGRRITVVRNYAEQLPRIMAVSDQIKQVLLNLLANAADACPQSGGVITISTWQKGESVAVAIKDTGTGINPEDMEQIFQPFYSTKGEAKGTGLGLSVSHGIIQDHQGEIQVESPPGEGATFTILLPINVVNEESDTVIRPIGA